MFRQILFAALAGSMTFMGSAMASEAEAQATIKGQLEAFLARDHNAAYGFAAPNVKSIFPNVDTFTMMVRRGYPQVYSPKNYSFGRNRTMPDGSFAQEVLLTGPKNKNWSALYTLKVQEDGQMRITGVQILPSETLAL